MTEADNTSLSTLPDPSCVCLGDFPGILDGKLWELWKVFSTMQGLFLIWSGRWNQLDSSRMAFWLPKEGIQKKFPPEYHESTEADKLPPHRPFDHKMELELGEEPSYFKNRPLSMRELEAIKKYLDDHFTK